MTISNCPDNLNLKPLQRLYIQRLIRRCTDCDLLLSLEMWANAHHDGRPAEYRWCRLFNAAKLGWRPLLECRVVTLPRRKTRWNLHGCPKPTKLSQPLVGRSSHYAYMWRRYCCFTLFFRLSIHALVAKIYPDKVVGWCPYGDFLAIFCMLYFQRAACNTFQTPAFWIYTKATPCVEVR